MGSIVLGQQLNRCGGLGSPSSNTVFNIPADEVKDECGADVIEQLCLFRWR